MANVFDQFDQTASPAAPPPQAAPTSAAPAAPQTNPFDQFDAPTDAAAEPEKTGRLVSPGELASEAGKGLITGIPNALTAIVGAQERGRSMGAIMPGADVMAGFLEPVIEGFTGKKMAPDTKNDKLIQEGLSAIKANPNDYFPEPDTPQGRIARMIGEGAVTMGVPGLGEETGLAKLGQIAKELFTGAVSGGASQAAMEVAPDNLKPAAGLIGGLAGGIGAHGVATGLGALPDLAGKGLDALSPIVSTKGNVERLAAKKLGSIVEDRDAALAGLADRPHEIVPGVEPTANQIMQDRGIGSYQRSLERNDPEFKNSLLNRLDQQGAARVAALENLQDAGNPAAVADYFRLRMHDLETRADDLYSQAEGHAQQAHDALGDASAGDIGAQARTAMTDRFKKLNGEANHLWEAIDPHHDLHVPPKPLVNVAARIYGAMSPEEQLSLSPGEKRLAGIIGSYGDMEALPFDRFKQLRTAINTAMREAKSPLLPNNQAYGRLTQLRGAVEDAVADSIAGKVGEDQQAVAAGQKAPDDTLAANFVRQAKEWYGAADQQTATGNVSGAGDAVPAAAPAAAVSGDLGTTGQGERGPAGDARLEGLPGNADIGAQGALNAENVTAGPAAGRTSGSDAGRGSNVGRGVQREPLPQERIAGIRSSAVTEYPDGRHVHEIKNPKAFTSAVKRAKQSMGPVGAQVGEAPGTRQFLFDDGKSGFALDGDNIISLFSSAGSPPGVASRAIEHAVANGGRRLDGFDTFLPRVYAKNGFRAVAKVPFDDNYAPEGWDRNFFAANYGTPRPDITFMVYDPEHASSLTDNRVSGYDEGEAAQAAALRANTMAERFAAAGRPEEEAKANGALVDAFYSTMGASEDQFPLPEVRRGDVSPEGALNQLAANPANEFVNYTNSIANASWWPSAISPLVKLVKKITPDYGYDAGAIKDAIEGDTSIASAALAALDKMGWTPGDIDKHGGLVKTVQSEVENIGKQGWLKSPQSKIAEDSLPKPDANPLDEFVNTPDEQFTSSAHAPLKKLLLEHKAKIGHFDDFANNIHKSGLWSSLLAHAKQYKYDDGASPVSSQVAKYAKDALDGKHADKAVSPSAQKSPMHSFIDRDMEALGYPPDAPGTKVNKFLNKIAVGIGMHSSVEDFASRIDNHTALRDEARKLLDDAVGSKVAAEVLEENNGSYGNAIVSQAEKFEDYLKKNTDPFNGNLVVDKAKDALAYAKETPAGQKFFGDYSASKTPAKQAPPPEGPKLPPKDLTQTTAFKNWFGDSAVVDDNGKPQVVYHGTRNGGFRQFKEGSSFFAADPKTSRTYSGSNDKPIELTHPEDLLNHPERAAKELHDPTLKIVRHPPVGAKGEDWYTITYREPYSHDRVVDHYSSRFDALHAIDLLAESADKLHGTKTTGLYPVYLKMEHPFEVDWEGNDWSTGPYIDGASNEPVTRYDVYLDGDHYDTYDNYDDAQQKVDEHLDELRSNAESEMRDRLQDKFQIVAPTPLFGDKNYVVYQLDDDGERITDSVYDGPQEFEDLAGVQAYIEDTINNKAEDAGTEAIDNSESHVSETDDYEDNGGHEGLSTDKVVSMVRNGDLGDGNHDGVIFRDIKDTLNGTGAPATDVFVPFAPEQIKSVDNIGTFSANSPRLLFQPAYHSSPHSFDKFELSPRTSKTGEGNHDFGYGHYFSTHDKAREFYRRTVAGPGGKEYKVDLPETNELLQWHHAFNEMSPEVQAKTNAALKTAGLGPAGSKMTGEQVYNLLAKKLGSQEAASAALRDAGVPGHQYLSGQLSGVPRDKAASNFVMYDPSRIKIEGKSTVDGLGQGDARGAIEFGDDGSSIIHMLKNADASTGLHELGHHFLKMYKSMADHPNAPAALRGDWATVKDWWKKNAVSVAHDSANKDVQPAHVRAVLENGTTGNATLDEAVNRGFHEQWARAFERYLRDGIAPSSKLQAVFDKFKGWLTKVYHSLAGLNVDLSPEMKGVFDRMLATPETPIPAPKMMDAAAAGRFKAASAATKNIKETFGAKPVNKMMQRPGASYPYTMPNEAVAGALWKAGPEGASTIKSVLEAAGDAKEARSAIEAAAVLSLKRAAAKDGVIDPAKLSAWRAKHADALAEVPGLEKRLSDAGKAAEAMVRIGESRRKVIAQVQKTAVGKLLNLSSDTDVAATVGSMLGRKDAVKAMAELMRTASNDPAATDGLRRAVVDHMLGRLKSSKDVLRSDTFQRFLGKNTPALAKVLTPQQMNGLRAIAQDLKRASKDYRAPGGGSDTAENLAAGNYYGTTKPTILGQIMHRVVQAATSSGVGYVLGVLTHPLAGIAGAIGSGAMAIARDAGMTKVNDLIKEAILNPDLMEALLKKAPKRANTGSHTGLAATLGKIALTAGVLSQQ